MQFSMLIGPIVLPVIFWTVYHYHKDRHLPEPARFLALAFVLGVGSYWLGRSLYIGLELFGLREDASLLAETDTLHLLYYALFVIGPIEEVAKLLPFVFVILRLDEFDEPIDGIIYASFIALGFAAVENYFYLDYVTSIEAIARGFAGPVIHIVLASIWGHYIGMAYLRKSALLPTILFSFIGVSLIHGLYDYLVIAMPGFALPASAALVVSIWIWRVALLRRLHLEAHKNSSSAIP